MVKGIYEKLNTGNLFKGYLMALYSYQMGCIVPYVVIF
jgi:hypothetical protein